MGSRNPLDEATFSIIQKRPADPAVGAALVQLIDNARWQRLVSIQFEVVTSVNVANRIAYVRLDDATGEILRLHAPGVQTASETILYNFAQGLPALDFSADASAMDGPLPDAPRLYLPGQVVVYLENVDASDQIQNAVLSLHSWFSG